MDELKLIGGSDLYGAGTYGTALRDTATFTFDSTSATSSDTSDITVNGVTTIINRGVEDIDTCFTEYVIEHAAKYLAVGTILTNPNLGVLVFTGVDNKTTVTASITNNDATFEGVLVLLNSKMPHPIKSITSYNAAVISSIRQRIPGVVNKVSTMTITGNSGTANIVYGVYKFLMSFATDLYTTLVNFITANYESIAREGFSLYIGGTSQVETVTLTGVAGTANISGAGGLTRLVTFTGSLDASARNFVLDFAADYLAVGIKVVSIANTLVFSAVNKGQPFTAPTITYVSGHTAQVETITLTGTSGTANVTGAGGLTSLVTFGSTLTDTAADFVVSHNTAYAAVGIIISSHLDTIIFTAAVAGVAFTAPVITNVTDNLAGTVAHTTPNATTGLSGSVAHTTASVTSLVFSSNRNLFSEPTIANATGNLAGTVVTTGADGLIAATKEFFGTAIEAGMDIYFEYPVEEITIDSGDALFNFIN